MVDRPFITISDAAELVQAQERRTFRACRDELYRAYLYGKIEGRQRQSRGLILLKSQSVKEYIEADHETEGERHDL